MRAKRKRIFIDKDVVTEAKVRINRILDSHDDVVVAFSGGKDSLAVLYLLKTVLEEKKELKKIKVWFRDEEVINQSIVDFVKKIEKLDWVDLEWWTIPMKGTYAVLGEIYPYIQWDEKREWVRKKPENSINLQNLELPSGTVLDQFSCDAIMAKRRCRGKVAILNGMRTDESIYRLAALFAKPYESYICKSPSSKQVSLCKPIYDWKEMDVLKYLWENKTGLCPHYDHRGWAKENLRVATAINVQAAKRIDTLASIDPDLWEKLIKIFPVLVVQARYFKESSAIKTDPKYTQDLNGVRQWVEDFIDDPATKNKALNAINKAEPNILKNPAAFPFNHVLSQIRSQGGNRPLLPISAKEQTQKKRASRE